MGNKIGLNPVSGGACKTENKGGEIMGKKKIIIRCGNCPNCGSNDLLYGECAHEGEGLYYEFKCSKCGKEGQEWYNLEWAESIII